MNGIWLFIVLQGIVFGGFCAWLAKQKDRDPVGWFLLGVLFSLIALIAIAAVPKVEDRSRPTKSSMELPWEREKREADSTNRVAMVIGGIVIIAVLFILIAKLLNG